MLATCLTVPLILRWADAHRQRTGSWPHARSGPVDGAPGQTWGAVNRALARGGRGLPGGSSLARLLGESRGRRDRAPALDAGQILLWADAHFRAFRRLLRANSGPVPDAPWGGAASARSRGRRGFPGGQRLAGLLRPHGRGAPGRRRSSGGG